MPLTLKEAIDAMEACGPLPSGNALAIVLKAAKRYSETESFTVSSSITHWVGKESDIVTEAKRHMAITLAANLLDSATLRYATVAPFYSRNGLTVEATVKICR